MELRELDGALDAAMAGRGRLVLISGEPGIDKTTLAEELSDAGTSSSLTP
ncbi:MAG TPA: ATP-binding protein [Acidimicrobiales bacterium]|nr:ATP-binding protein [Acidimicrobiales bacterium]